MSIAPYIKVIGRGKDGARPLSTEQAHDLFSQVLDRQVTDRAGDWGVAQMPAYTEGGVRSANQGGSCIFIPEASTNKAAARPCACTRRPRDDHQ